jgi:hypothetical protein
MGLVISSTSAYTAHALDSTAVNLTGKITFRNEKLTTKITATSLRQVMEEISKVSGVQLRWLDSGGEEPVTVDFVALPLSKAIPRLLGERHFLLFYSSTGEGARLTQVWISSRKTGTKHLEDTQQPLSQEFPLPILSEEEVPEEDVVPPDMLLQTALYDHSSAARLEAIGQLEGYSHQDPRIAAALSHLADTDSDPQVREAAAEALRRLE